MALIKCGECGKEISDKAISCPNCGCPVNNEKENMPKSTEAASTPKKKKKGHGCLITILIFILFAVGLSVGISQAPKTESTSSDRSKVVFDAAQFNVTEDGELRPMHESEVIDLLGEAESVEEWNYTTASGLQYPIRSLSYGNGKYIYEFNNDYLLRIQILESFPYKDRNDFMEMFNLKKYSNTWTDDNNVNCHIYNCGVYDLWLMDITDTEIGITYLTYFSGVFDSI